ncbi:hypothetical protein G6F59_018174 [Rhizopus arrhizus]|nr:hypothetical protein G6F59_018174 [Rhizopus arrhizus]
MQGGFSAKQVALAYHLLAQFLVASSRAEAAKQLPIYHRDFIQSRLESMPAEQYPGARYVSDAFSSLDTDLAFETGLQILLDGIANWTVKLGAAVPPKRKPRATKTA